MIEHKDIPINKISWLSSYPKDSTGIIENFYEPENIQELIEICNTLSTLDQVFDIVGHTSNIYFMPNCQIKYLVSTRKLRSYTIDESTLECDCGVPVSRLAKEMVEAGYCGYEGLIDLPGTIGAALYGNAGCYKCLVSDNLISIKLLRPDGTIEVVPKEEMGYRKRSSILKRNEKTGIILCASFKLIKGYAAVLQEKAACNHRKRVETQPGPQNNLGSIYGETGNVTICFKIIKLIAQLLTIIVIPMVGRKNLTEVTMRIILTILGCRKLQPYLYSWNRFIWKDEKSHELFWEYLRLHDRLYKNSKLEIEIRK